MNTFIAVIPAAVAALVALPAPVLAAQVTPGPVRIVLPAYPDEEPRLGDESQLLVTPSVYIGLPQGGSIVWRGTLTRAGKLTFPVATQKWPEHPTLKQMRITGVKGSVSKKGKVVLTGTVKALVMGCRVSGPLRLSSSFSPGLGLPGGAPYNRTDGSFALMSTSIPLTRTGGCGMIPASVSLFLTGTLTSRR
jgi:hypothetical protein